MLIWLLGVMSFSVGGYAISNSVNCSSTYIGTPLAYDVTILNVTANKVINATVIPPIYGGSLPPNVTTISYCDVRVRYTHLGWNDDITVEAWLPLSGWNGRFQGIGGGGWNGGLEFALGPAVASGYAAAITDAGYAYPPTSVDVQPGWAMTSPGNPNLLGLIDLASSTLHDLAVIGKAVTTSFYGSEPKYSYWNGCSQGGRQGMMIAQRYPDIYDGIVANAPAINWVNLVPGDYWPQQIMNQLQVYPTQCELDGFREGAVNACDALDGLEDGIIGAPELCGFDPYSLVGQNYTCGANETLFLSNGGAAVANATWNGSWLPTKKFGWYGLNKDANTSQIAATVEAANGTSTGSPYPISKDWIVFFLAKNSTYDTSRMTDEDYFTFFHKSRDEYASIIDTSDPDLSGFQKAGGKMLTWHGLADDLIPPRGTEDYYRRVLGENPQAGDFYRYFEAPGVSHCTGGIGPLPNDALEKLVDWVEHNKAPETLIAISSDGTVRNICKYPLVQRYVGGDVKSSASFQCMDTRASYDLH